MASSQEQDFDFLIDEFLQSIKCNQMISEKKRDNIDANLQTTTTAAEEIHDVNPIIFSENIENIDASNIQTTTKETAEEIHVVNPIIFTKNSENIDAGNLQTEEIHDIHANSKILINEVVYALGERNLSISIGLLLGQNFTPTIKLWRKKKNELTFEFSEWYVLKSKFEEMTMYFQNKNKRRSPDALEFCSSCGQKIKQNQHDIIKVIQTFIQLQICSIELCLKKKTKTVIVRQDKNSVSFTGNEFDKLKAMLELVEKRLDKLIKINFKLIYTEFLSYVELQDYCHTILMNPKYCKDEIKNSIIKFLLNNVYEHKIEIQEIFMELFASH